MSWDANLQQRVNHTFLSVKFEESLSVRAQMRYNVLHGRGRRAGVVHVQHDSGLSERANATPGKSAACVSVQILKRVSNDAGEEAKLALTTKASG